MAAAGLLAAAALVGCGGGGSDGAPGATGPTGPAGATGPTGPAGSNAVATVSVAALSASQWADANFSATVTAVTIASPPVVTFKVSDAFGNPVSGLASNTSQSATATLPGYTNVSFAIAKLVPGTNGDPSKWVSYIVTTVPTKNATTGAVTASAPARPTTDNTGKLEETSAGSYKYTFYRDITKAKADVAAMTVTAPSVLTDLGDLTYEPTLTHRLTVAISGNARGTGTNTADAVQLVTGVPMKNPVNAIYDFIPATGKAVTATDTQREVTQMAACASCHSKFAFHGGGRQDPRYCVVCHTDQRKYGQARATSVSNAFPALTKTVSATGSVSYSPFTYVADGEVAGNLPILVHKVHMGKELTKKNYNFANVVFNEVTYPQSITNCVKCHSASSATPQGDNWKKVPTIAACGACHDGINFATGRGTALGETGKFIGGHVGGAQADNSKCSLCHDAATVPVYHVTVDPTGSSGRAGYPVNTAADVPTVGFPSGQGPSIPLASQLGNLPAGVFKINFEIKQATVSGAADAKKATVVYRILKDGAPVTLNSTGYLINNVDGTPSIYVAYAVPQDGIAAPADWNASASATVLQLRDKLSGNTQTGPDTSGYYTATLAATIPDAAKMVTAAIGINYQGFVQLGHAAFPKGIRLREPQFVTKLADGFTARRTIVANAKCNSCHGQLGVSPSFHGGARNNGEGCAICHTANNSTGHTGAAYSFGGGWNVGIKNLVHSIHSSKKREQAFTYEATLANPDGFKEVTYPGVLKNCEQCHVAGSYDFSATANAAAVPNLLWTTDAKTDMSNPTNAATLGLSPWITSLGRGQTSYTADNLVTSPVTSACFGCHDSKIAVSHYLLNGGTVYGSVSAVSTGGARPAVGASTGFGFTKVESCMVCHATGKVGDIKAAHMN